MAIARSLMTYLLLTVIYQIYLSRLADQVPLDDRLLVNFIYIPLSLGFLCAVFNWGTIFRTIVIAALIPVLPGLLQGGDPAKSGMEFYIIFSLSIVFSIGSLGGYFFKSLLVRVIGKSRK